MFSPRVRDRYGTDFLRDLLQVLERDPTALLDVEEPEDLQDLLFRVAVAHSRRHNLEELLEGDSIGGLLAEIADDLAQLFLFDLDAEGLHAGPELPDVDFAGLLGVEKIEGLLQLVLGFFVDLRLGAELLSAASS